MKDESLTEKDFEIIDYISHNPGTSKEAIIRDMQARSTSSRVTTFKRIQQLVANGSIVAQKEKPNSQIYKLYVNKSDEASQIMQEIRTFERSFFSHLQKIVDLYHKEKQNDSKKEKDVAKTVAYTCGFFYVAIDAYLSLARRVWPNQIQDEETLGKLYSNFFVRIAKMETRLISYSRNEPVVASALSEPPASFPWVGPVYTRLLKRFGLYTEFEALVGSLKSLDLHFLFS